MQMLNSKIGTRDAIKQDNIELKNAKLLYVLMSALLIVDWALPPYFGIHIAFDFTGTRILVVLIGSYFLLNRKAGNHFIKSMLDVQVTPFLAFYMLVMVMITVLRVNINTFFMNFLDIITFYLVYYGIRYVIGVKRSINWTVKIAGFFGIYGIIEYALSYSPMLKYLKTMEHLASEGVRSGQYRIMGPCVHSIAYGMMLLLLLVIICIDYDNDELDLFRHPVIYVLLMINIVLTGSRGSLAFAIVESALIILFSNRQKRRKTLILLFCSLLIFAVVEAALIKTSFGQYIMIQIMSVVDEILGTSYGAYFGANTTLLNQSSSYRDLLPKVFTVDWLNPLIGRGANASVGFEFEGVYIQSIDNFYVAAYIRYAYPGLIAYVLFLLGTIFFMLKTGFQKNSGLCKGAAIGFIIYCCSLFLVDNLQTTQYMYILIALFYAYKTGKEKKYNGT